MKVRLRLPERLERFDGVYRWVEACGVVTALFLLVLQFGFGDEAPINAHAGVWVDAVLLAALYARVPFTFLFSSTLRTAFSRCGTLAVPMSLSIGVMAWAVLTDGFSLRMEWAVVFSLLGACVIHIFNGIKALQRRRISPLLLFSALFVLVIIVGASLLMLPASREEGVEMTLVDAAFMSASATCVTGLSLYDIGRQFTPFGQSVILVLIQLGGLGIMTFAAASSVLFGGGMSLKDRAAMGQVLNEVSGKIGRTLMLILATTFAAEGLGALIMFGRWVDDAGAPLHAGAQLYYSVFHSVSAFCNAGFGLHGDSLVRYNGEPGVVLTIGCLVVLGGIGFSVIADLGHYRPWHTRLARRLPVIGKRARRKPLPRLSLHTKLALCMTLGLIGVGTIAFWLLEKNAALADMSLGDQALASLYNGGITARTAGFNTVDFSILGAPVLFFIILKMIIGGSPGSAAGGLKTTSVAILLLSLWATLRRRPVEIFKRRIPEDQVSRVLVLLVIALVLVNGAVFTLCITEPHIVEQKGGFLSLTFETVSAFATVGLSMGVTDDLSQAGRVVITLCMFVGRVGPLTLLAALGAQRAGKYEYPSEQVMLG